MNKQFPFTVDKPVYLRFEAPNPKYRVFQDGFGIATTRDIYQAMQIRDGILSLEPFANITIKRI